jgi:hypothetical protein
MKTLLLSPNYITAVTASSTLNDEIIQERLNGPAYPLDELESSQ